MARTLTFTEDAAVNKVCLERLAAGGFEVQIHYTERRYDADGRVIEEKTGQVDIPVVGTDISVASLGAVRTAITNLITNWKGRKYA